MPGAVRTPARAGVLVVCWVVVVAVGWAGYYAVGGGGDAGSEAGARALCWLAGIPPAVVTAALLWRTFERRARLIASASLIPLCAGGWGIANALGWTVDVTVGGPATGLVTGTVLVAATLEPERLRRARLSAVVVVGLVALVGGRLVAGVEDVVPRTLLPIAFGLVGAGAAWWLARVGRSFGPVAASMVVWWAGWLIGFEVSKWMGAPALQVVVELGLACMIGGAASWLLLARGCGERIGVVLLRWAGTSVAGTVLGILIAAVVWELGLAPTRVLQPSDLWAAGTTFGLGLAAAVALVPTMSALSASWAERVASPADPSSEGVL